MVKNGVFYRLRLLVKNHLKHVFRCSLLAGMTFPLLFIGCAQMSEKKVMKEVKQRLPASETEFFKDYRLYSVTEYLPREMQIYQRSLPMELNLTAKLHESSRDIDVIQCRIYEEEVKGFASENFIKEFQITKNSTVMELSDFTRSIFCQYRGIARHIDFTVGYSVKPHRPSPYEYGGEELEKVVQEKLGLVALKTSLDLAIQNQKFDRDLISKLESRGLLKSLKKRVNASIIYNTVIELELNDYIEHVSSTGLASPGGMAGSSYGPIGLNGSFSLVKKEKLLVPNAEPFSLICGFKGQGTYQKLIFQGLSTVGKGRTGNQGTLVCSFNTKAASFSEATGSFEISLKHLRPIEAQASLQQSLIEIEQKIVAFEEKKKEVIIKETLSKGKTLSFYLNKVEALDKNLRQMEPPKYCKVTESSPAFALTEGLRMSTNAVGEFCGNPAKASTTLFMAACDGLKGPGAINGRLYLFNDKMQVVKKVTIPSLRPDDSITSVDSSRIPVVLYDEKNAAKGFAVSTYDARILFYDLSLREKNVIKLDDAYVINDLHKIGNDKIVVLVDYEEGPPLRQISKLVFIENAKVVNLVEIPNDDLIFFSQTFIYNEKLYVSTDQGKILIYDLEGNLLKKVMVEAKTRLSKVNVSGSRIYVGSQSGKVYTIDWSDTEEMKPNLIAQLPYSGETQLNHTNRESFPIPPIVAHQPMLVGEDGLVVASVQDGRLYFMNRSGQIQKIVQTNYVRELFDFGQMVLNQQNFIVATSISYINVYLPTGEKVATYSNTGAENFFTPMWMSGNSFAAGMYRGVFQFKLKRLEGTNESEHLKVCE